MSQPPNERPPEGEEQPEGHDLAPTADEGEPPASQPVLPESPFTTEQIDFMRADERVGVVLRGGRVGSASIPTAVAGSFLYRLHQLVHAVVAVLSGRRLGSRGTLPPVADAGLLALVGVQWTHSAVFHFSVGAGEQVRIGDTGSVESLTEEALNRIFGALAASASGDADLLWSLTRELGPRVGTNFESLVDVFVQQEVDSVWQFAEQPGAIDLSATRAYRAKTLLAHEEVPRVHEQVLRGYLYRVDAREHAFVLEPLDEKEDKVTGHYPEHLREDLRDAWDRVVTVRLRTTHQFLARQIEPASVAYELIEVLSLEEV